MRVVEHYWLVLCIGILNTFIHKSFLHYDRMDIHQVVKVADFGLSVSVTGEKDYFRAGEFSAEKLPVKWLAPESLSDRKFSELSDVV